MESFIVIAILVTMVSAYLLQQFLSHSLVIDEPAVDLSPPEHDAAGELKAA